MKNIILFALSLTLLTGCMGMCGMGGHTRNKGHKHEEPANCVCNCIETLGRCDCAKEEEYNHKA